MIDPEYKYKKTSYVDRGRKCDQLLALFISQFSAGTLPTHWANRDQEAFLARYENLGDFVWASSVSCHLLLYRGSYVFRVWTDVAKHCYVDVSDLLAGRIVREPTLLITAIPSGAARKCRPFTQRVRVYNEQQVALLCSYVKEVYGLESSRVPLRVWK